MVCDNLAFDRGGWTALSISNVYTVHKTTDCFFHFERQNNRNTRVRSTSWQVLSVVSRWHIASILVYHLSLNT